MLHPFNYIPKEDFIFYLNEKFFDKYFEFYLLIHPKALEDESLFDKEIDRIYALIYGDEVNE